jgi:hypothetical protein
MMVNHAMETKGTITRDDLARWWNMALGANDHHNPRPGGMPIRREDGKEPEGKA